MLTPNRERIYRAAWDDARARGMSSAEAHAYASGEYERARAAYQAAQERDASADNDEPEMTQLRDPQLRSGLYERRPWLKDYLQGQVGPSGWHLAEPSTELWRAGRWDTFVFNEWLTARVSGPRQELVEKAQQLAKEKKIDFMIALEEIKTAEPALVERCARWTRY